MGFSFRTNGNFIDFVHIDETSLHFENTIKSLHNTSRCINWSLPEDTTRISFTIDEVKYSDLLVTDIDFDGVVMDSQDDFETGITAMFTGLAGSPGGSSYLVYVDTLAQVGTANPTKANLQNTLGVDEWTRDNQGEFSVITTTPFVFSKIWVNGAFIDAGAGTSYFKIGTSTTFEGAYQFYFEADGGGNLKIFLYVKDNTGAAKDISFFNSYSNFCLPEIRVYP